ncbi:ABC transporter permease [Rhodococcus sp. X156]|uniref:ABC transporter permease n=1 Tax=Rhodococcus sp. X156 TaxID=2499145 RepID=UPI000FD7ADCA|nr:ABC transporter permease [Rhodococcus sp. X156]
MTIQAGTTAHGDPAQDPAQQPQRSTIVAALASSERPTPPGPLATSLTFGWRALLKIKHIPEQLFDVTAFPIMFTLLFTFLFGGALAGSTEDYIQFLLPGILVQGVIMITMYTGSTLRTDIDRGVFDRFRSLPIWRPSALVGMLLGDAVRFTISCVVTITLGLILGWRPDSAVGVVLGVLLILVFAFGLSWVWTFLGLLLRTPGAVMGVSMFVITPLTFGSNIFVDPATMPGWLQAFVDVNPVTHLVTAVRALMGGTPVGSSVFWTLFAAAVWTAFFGSLTMWRYRDAS